MHAPGMVVLLHCSIKHHRLTGCFGLGSVDDTCRNGRTIQTASEESFDLRTEPRTAGHDRPKSDPPAPRMDPGSIHVHR